MSRFLKCSQSFSQGWQMFSQDGVRRAGLQTGEDKRTLCKPLGVYCSVNLPLGGARPARQYISRDKGTDINVTGRIHLMVLPLLPATYPPIYPTHFIYFMVLPLPPATYPNLHIYTPLLSLRFSSDPLRLHSSHQTSYTWSTSREWTTAPYSPLFKMS